MRENIFIKIVPKGGVIELLEHIFTEKYRQEELTSKQITQKLLSPYFDKLKPNLYAVIEYPYVDRMYRDTYYSFYSSKLEPFHRDSIRISFFDIEITSHSFTESKFKEDVIAGQHYLGFISIRPTFPKVIGRTALSPKAFIEDNFVSCQAKINSTVNFLKFKVSCFPHSSQDGQVISCAETTIWSLLEYFGNKYPDYRPILPSDIHKTLRRFSYKRLTPSEGLTAEQVTFAIREFGFGAMIYSEAKYPDFEAIISTYIESGIPVVGVLNNQANTLGHAVNIIGREKESPDKVLSTSIETIDGSETELQIIDFNKVSRRYVFIDDNYPPYRFANLKTPFKEYYESSKFHDCQLKSIIVPLYPKIYLDAVRARHNFRQFLKNTTLGINKENKRIVKTFLVSSRSFKEYLTLNEEIDIQIKHLILLTTMPKFIWVAEVSSEKSFQKEMVDGFILQDATEPIQEIDQDLNMSITLICSYVDGKYFTMNFGKLVELTTFAQPFKNYDRNLR